MNLDDLAYIQTRDPHNMIAHINALPDHLETAWKLGLSLELSAGPTPRAVLLCGMGASALSAELLAAYASPLCPVPLVVLRDYDLPAWAAGASVLVIAISHSGDTEETLAAFNQAVERGCRCLALTTGGRLAQLCRASSSPLWLYQSAAPSRAADGFIFGLLLAALSRLDLIPDPGGEFQAMLSALRGQQAGLLPEVQTVRNPSKRLAGQMVGRLVTVFAAGHLAAVARRLKNQINENAKAAAFFETLPESNHNTLAGINNPEVSLSHLMALFLTASTNHDRNQIRLDFTRQIFMTQGINTDIILARGESRLAQIWTVLHFGDYTSYYLAMGYDEDPTPTEPVALMKQALASM